MQSLIAQDLNNNHLIHKGIQQSGYEITLQNNSNFIFNLKQNKNKKELINVKHEIIKQKNITQHQQFIIFITILEIIICVSFARKSINNFVLYISH